LKIVLGKTDAERFSPIVRFVGDDAIWFLASMNKGKKARIILSFTIHDLIPEHGVRSGIFQFNISNLPQVDEFLRFYYANSAVKRQVPTRYRKRGEAPSSPGFGYAASELFLRKIPKNR
jgi:hypothetical protein